MELKASDRVDLVTVVNANDIAKGIANAVSLNGVRAEEGRSGKYPGIRLMHSSWRLRSRRWAADFPAMPTSCASGRRGGRKSTQGTLIR